MKKAAKIMACAVMLTLLGGGMTSFAGEWKTDAKGWWYVKDGGYAVSEWVEHDGKWYYFDGEGYMVSNAWIGNYYLGADGAMLVDTTTPDGYKVGADGAWTQDGSFTDPELSVTPYQALSWDKCWAEFSRDSMVDHGDYYELPNQTLCVVFYNPDLGCDDTTEVYTGSIYLYKNATYEGHRHCPSFSSVEQCLLFTEQHYNDSIYRGVVGYDNGSFRWMLNREDMDEKGFLTKFYPNWAG